jgi:tripartite-type tricarboxylate transporter receptor subunit TctC
MMLIWTPLAARTRALLVLLGAAAVGLAWPFNPVLAQSYPSRPLRLVVPFPPGGGADILGRTIAEALAGQLAQSVLVDNRAGANTIVGAEIAARASADGYTLLLAPGSTLAVNPAAYAKLPYDAVRDFAPIARIASNYQVVAARRGFAPNTIAELVKLAQSRPDSISYGSVGNGSPSHFGGVLLETMAGIRMLHVPYKGNTQVLADLVGEQVDIHLVGPPSVQGLVKSGKLKLLAATSEKRLPIYPDLPTIAESGYPGYTSGAWYTMVTRAGSPVEVITTLNRAINAVLVSAPVKTALERDGYIVDAGASPADTAAFIAAETKKWAGLVRAAGVKFD